MGSVVGVVCLLSFSILMQFRCVALAAVSCHTDNPVSSSCYQTDSCLTDHPPLQEKNKCLEMYQSSEVSMYPPHVESCPVNRRCNSFTSHSQNEWQYFALRSVDLEITAVDALHFKVNVSWDYPDVERAINISQPERRLQGYELRLYENNSEVECLCIWARRVFNTIIGLNHTLRYRPSTTLQARVYTLPFSNNFLADSYAKWSDQVPWPRTCNTEGISFDPGFCPPPLYQQPQHILTRSTVFPDSTTEIQVSWLHPSTSSEPNQLNYYVNCIYQNYSYTFLANGTHNITISGLDASQDYYIQVQAYSSCSGFSSFSSTSGPGEISCGILSKLIRVSGVETTSLTTSEPITETTSSTSATSQGDYLLLNVIIALVTVVMALLLLVLVVSIVIYLRCHYRRPNVSNTEDSMIHYIKYMVCKTEVVLLDVLVLYTLETPKEEQALIETYVVSRLLYRNFEVRSCNNHTEKTIVDWVEEQARLARAVLIVCNKSFYREWNLPSQQRSPLVNALATIIQSSVSEGDIKKYATLLLGEKSEQYIPDNSYLKSMEVFVLKMDSSDRDMEKIAEFVKDCHR